MVFRSPNARKKKKKKSVASNGVVSSFRAIGEERGKIRIRLLAAFGTSEWGGEANLQFREIRHPIEKSLAISKTSGARAADSPKRKTLHIRNFRIRLAVDFNARRHSHAESRDLKSFSFPPASKKKGRGGRGYGKALQTHFLTRRGAEFEKNLKIPARQTRYAPPPFRIRN